MSGVGIVKLEFWLAWKATVTSRVTLVCWIVISVWVTLAGPFGTYDAFGWPKRALFWSSLIALGIILGVFARHFVTSVLEVTSFLPSAILISTLNSLLMTLPLSSIVEGVAAPKMHSVPDWQELAVFIFALTFGVAIVRHVAGFPIVVPKITNGDLAMSAPAPSQTLQWPSEAQSPVVPRLIERLVPDQQGDLHAISVRDHYVDVRTKKGISSLLMRLSDAIREAEGIDGSQVHRSHWVAWDAVTGVEKTGPGVALRLCDGSIVPVSRAHYPKLVARGLL